jgi:hypothetical protein
MECPRTGRADRRSMHSIKTKRINVENVGSIRIGHTIPPSAA